MSAVGAVATAHVRHGSTRSCAAFVFSALSNDIGGCVSQLLIALKLTIMALSMANV